MAATSSSSSSSWKRKAAMVIMRDKGWFLSCCICACVAVSFVAYSAFFFSYNNPLNIHEIQVITIFPNAATSSSSSTTSSSSTSTATVRGDTSNGARNLFVQSDTIFDLKKKMKKKRSDEGEGDGEGGDGDGDGEAKEAKEIENQLEVSLEAKNSKEAAATVDNYCDRKMVHWLTFCDHFVNHGFGKKKNEDDVATAEDSNSDSEEDSSEFAEWYGTDAYMLEVIFHSRMRSYRCLTEDPFTADVFFIPYYAGLDALRYLYGVDYAKRNEQGIELVEWLLSSSSSPSPSSPSDHHINFFKRNSGFDHFIVAGRTAWDFASYNGKWGTNLRLLRELENVTSLVMERRPWVDNEQAIPYPTSFHPSSHSRLTSWINKVESSHRTHLTTFIGAPRSSQHSIRGLLFQQCHNSSSCNIVNCSNIRCSHNPIPIAKHLLKATFCLQPQGDTYTRRSTFDSLICGCIPVFFHRHSAYTQYTMHLPSDSSSYSIHIREDQIRGGLVVEEFLRTHYPPHRIKSLQRNVRKLIPKILYLHPSFYAVNHSNIPSDAFDLTVIGMLQRAQQHQQD